MLRLLLPLSVLAACTPSPRKTVMPSPSPISANAVQGSSAALPDARGPKMRAEQGHVAQEQAALGQPAPEQAALGPIPQPVSAAGVSAPAMPVTDSALAALGRRTLSTAFVRIGPDGHLTVERHDGRALVLRDVTMGPAKYCGVESAGTRYCGSYAEVAAARPGGAATPQEPDRAGADPIASGRSPQDR